MQLLASMKAVLLVALGVAIPASTHAEERQRSTWIRRLTDPQLAFGGTLVFGGYAGSLLWARQGDGDHDVLYVPLFGPWLGLFTLPDCERIDLMCEHDGASRGILIASGATQLIGAGLILYTLTRDDDDRGNILIAPSMTDGNPGVTVRGRF